MKRKILQCGVIFLSVVVVIGFLIIRAIYNDTGSIPTSPTTSPPISTPTSTVVIINEIHYNFPTLGTVDTLPVTTPGTINVRTSPTFDGNSILTTAENGETFMLLGITQDGQFFISEYEGQTVFLSTKVITILE